MLARRRFLQGMGLAAAALAVAGVEAKVASGKAQTLAQRLAGIERQARGRLGVTLLDGSGTVLGGQRQDERFPLCSTFKFVLAAAVLQRVDRGELALQTQVPIRAEDMVVSHAPATRPHVGASLGLAELCRAAMIFSDGVAANLLLRQVDGPAGLTRFLRTIGDTQTRSDRYEPEMNDFAMDDPRDTTTPAAMAASMRTLLLGEVLAPASRQRMIDWMRDNRTGDDCLRAGFPRAWKVGDKTGNNGIDTRNDIAIVWPPGRAPLLLTAYLNGAKVDEDARDAALKAVAVAVRETLAG